MPPAPVEARLPPPRSVEVPPVVEVPSPPVVPEGSVLVDGLGSADRATILLFDEDAEIVTRTSRERALLRGAIVARGTVIGPDHLVLEDTHDRNGDLTLASAVRRHVRTVLDRAQGDTTAAAALLGISEDEVVRHQSEQRAEQGD